MKLFALAALALVGQATRLEYAESEGPTKVDLGENDPEVVERAGSDDNPLGWTDDGEDDGVVLTMIDGSMVSASSFKKRKYHKGEHRPFYKFRGALTMLDGSMRPIYDEDGDGVEDNVHKTHDELDRFY